MDDAYEVTLINDATRTLLNYRVAGRLRTPSHRGHSRCLGVTRRNLTPRRRDYDYDRLLLDHRSGAEWRYHRCHFNLRTKLKYVNRCMVDGSITMTHFVNDPTNEQIGDSIIASGRVISSWKITSKKQPITIRKRLPLLQDQSPAIAFLIQRD